MCQVIIAIELFLIGIILLAILGNTYKMPETTINQVLPKMVKPNDMPKKKPKKREVPKQVMAMLEHEIITPEEVLEKVKKANATKRPKKTKAVQQPPRIMTTADAAVDNKIVKMSKVKKPKSKE